MKKRYQDTINSLSQKLFAKAAATPTVTASDRDIGCWPVGINCLRSFMHPAHIVFGENILGPAVQGVAHCLCLRSRPIVEPPSLENLVEDEVELERR